MYEQVQTLLMYPNSLTNYYCVHVTSLYKINRIVPSYFCGTKECPQSLLMGYSIPYLGSTKAHGQAHVWYPTTAVHYPGTSLSLKQAGVLKTPDVHHTLETAWKSH